MIHVGVIIAFLIVYLREAVEAPLLGGRLSPGGVVVLSIVPLLGWGGAYHVFVWRCARRIDREGSHRAVMSAERATRLFLAVSLVQHGAAVLVFGWLDLVRAWIGDPVLLDELIVLLTPVLAMSYAYLVMYPIDRRLREAALLSRIERGDSVHPFPSRARFVLLSTRQHVLFLLVPLGVILAWSEASVLALGAVGIDEHSAGASGVQMGGALLVLTLMPPVLCRLWDTVPLGQGEIRAAIARICEDQRVRVRELLLWRTGGTMVNGAVVGILPRLRYVVVTDALVEMLEPDEVAAVAAHEVGHVRRRHMLWLALCVLGTVLTLGAPLGWLVNLALGTPAGELPMAQETAVVVVLGLTLLGVLTAMGFVSRRFEWQADAFAVQHLSGMRPGGDDVTITPEAAAAMSGALRRVARLNAIDPNRFTWRHDSIRTRQKRIEALVGEPARSLPIDRVAGWVKLWCVSGLVLGGCFLALDLTVLAPA